MKSRIIILASLICVLALGLAAESRADISTSAVLFLRIAPGSRAAAMGESYVAIADDATATHWNPAGLGNAPLSDTWIDADVPIEYRPLKKIAPIKTGTGGNYTAYEVWAIGRNGLLRYDNRRWNYSEVFSTRTDETVLQKVRSYFRVDEGETMDAVVAQVVAANSKMPLESLQGLRESVMAVLPEDHRDYERLSQEFDSLLTLYPLCMIRWDRFGDLQRRVRDGLEDSSLTDDEITRISVAVNNAYSRYIPEELEIPYSSLISGEPTALLSTGEVLLVGTTKGILRYNGRNWQYLGVADGLPSETVLSMSQVGLNTVLIGTDSGVVVYNGLAINPLTPPERNLPAGSVQAVGGRSLNDIYAVVNGDLYHFDGNSWHNSFVYTAVIDDSLQAIAKKFSLYGSAVERQQYIEKYTTMQNLLPAPAEAAIPQPSALAEQTGETVDSAAVEGEAEGETGEMAATDEAANEQPIESQETVVASAEAAPVKRAIPGVDLPIQAGQQVQIPYCVGIRADVNTIFVDNRNRVWLGTDDGLFSMTSSGWTSPGYTDHVVLEGETLDGIAQQSLAKLRLREDLITYTQKLESINDLSAESPLEVGQVIRVSANALAGEIRDISSNSHQIYFATDLGLVQLVNGSWERADLRGLGNAPMCGVNVSDAENWMASENKLVIKGRGRSELSLMHVNWLPELADDLFYDFAAMVFPVEGWGTFGVSASFISYGKFTRTNEVGADLGTFESFDFAVAGSYGTALTNKLRGGLSVKFIYSRLSDQGAGQEKGKGTSSGFAVDLGLLYLMSPRLQWGLALTNIGPKMAYIDAAQSDDLPRNLAFGFAYKLVRSDYNQIMITAEVNKLMVGLDDGFSQEIKEAILNGGIEYMYNDLIAARAGYIYDQEGDIKTPTVGVGLQLFERFKFDFSYVPSQSDLALANTLRISLGVML